MSQNHDFAQMLRALAQVFAAEDRPGGDMAAAALNEVADSPYDLPPPHDLDVVKQATDALRSDRHPAATAMLAALPLISWHHSGLENGKIRADIALAMATAELIGPDGMIYHRDVRVGLFAQAAGLDYVTRTHPAEETFVMLGGVGYWASNAASAQRREVGAYIHHPSGIPHSSVTKESALIAAWRWGGDIAYDGYVLTG